MGLISFDNVIDPILNLTDDELTDKERINTLTDSVIKLTKELRYNTSHLDFRNMPLVEGAINNIVGDVDGKYTQIIQDQNQIVLQVNNNQSQISNLSITQDRIQSDVVDMNKGMSSISQEVDNITSTVQSLDGQMTSISQDVDRITSTVQNLDGEMTSISQDVRSISLVVQDGEELAGIIIDSRGMNLIAEEINLIGVTRVVDKYNTSTYIEMDGRSLGLYSRNSIDFKIDYSDGHIRFKPYSAKMIMDGTVVFDGNVEGLYARFG